MNDRRLLVVTVMLAFGAIACGTPRPDSGPDDVIATSTAAPSVSGLGTTDGSVVLPPRRVALSGPELDLRVVPFDPASTWAPPEPAATSFNLRLVELAAHLDESQELPAGLSLRLDACVLAAPMVWILEGGIEAGGAMPRELVLEFHRATSDQVSVTYGLVTVEAAGAFSSVVDARRFPAPDGSFRSPLARNACTVRVAGTQIGDTVEATDPIDGVQWTAPVGTVHELGIGTRLTEPADPAAGWVWLNWLSPGLPFEDVVVVAPGPEMLVLAVAGEVDQRSGCRTIRTTVLPTEADHQVDVVQWLDCEALRSIGPRDLGEVEGLPGLQLSDYGEGSAPILHGRAAGAQLRIESRSLEAGVAVAERLEVRRNLLVADLPMGPLAGVQLDEAVASALVTVDGVERARFPYLDGWFILAEGVYIDVGDDIGVLETQVVVEFFARPTESGWQVQEGGAASWDGCLAAGGSASAEGGIVYAVAGEADWPIERLADGVWTALETTDGVFFESVPFPEGGEIESWSPELGVRLVDPPAACSDHG